MVDWYNTDTNMELVEMWKQSVPATCNTTHLSYLRTGEVDSDTQRDRGTTTKFTLDG